jgi:hypothetical protein
MKDLIRLTLLAAIGYWLFKAFANWQPNNITQDYAEREANQERGDLKHDVFLRNEMPIMAVGETPYAGINFSPLTPGPQQAPNKLQLQPKGLYPHPYDPTYTLN